MRTATLLLFGAVLAVAAPVAAQCTGVAGVDFTEVTIRDINTLPDGNVDALVAGGAGLTIEQIQGLVEPALLDERVQFTAVLLTDPFKSGIRSLNADGIPGGIHTFMRDVNAATMGNAGMGTQVIDFSGTGTLQAFFAGDELIVCGNVEVFEGSGGSAMQIAVESAVFTGTSYGPEDPLRQPVVVTTDDLHNTFDVDGDPQSQIDWTRYEEFNGAYIRLENVELLQGVNDGDRPNLLYSTSGQDSEINQYDTSVCFRNDRGPEYFPTPGSAPDCIDDDYVAPSTGIINVQGFLIFQGDDGTFDYAVPDEANYVLNPFEASDFEIAVAPPIVTIESAGLATTDGALVRATVIPGTAGNTIASVVADYTTTSGASGQVALANTTADTYEGTITGLTLGDFVTYEIVATDNLGAATPPGSPVTRRVVGASITSIFDVQVTPDGGPGDSGVTTAEPVPFNLDASVQSAFTSTSSSGTVRYYATIQDDASLSPFSGVWMYFDTTDPGLSVGDQINITQARVVESFGVTTLQSVTFTTTGTGFPLADKVVSTGLFSGSEGPATAEQHEGILLSFDDAMVTATNADAPAGPFGEFLISTGGTSPLRVDDFSDGVVFESNDPGTVYIEGNVLDFVRGPLYFSFGNYKLAPASSDDLGEVINIANEGGLETANVRIVGTYPNPAAGALRVQFELAAAGDVSLVVFDAMGREVATVAEGAFGAARHTVEADLSGLATGIYVVRLIANGEVATSRLAIVR